MAATRDRLSLSKFCSLFCCPPWPSKITAKLACWPPDPTYTLRPDQSGSRWTLDLSDGAYRKLSHREKGAIECSAGQNRSAGNSIACMSVRCATEARYTVLFSRGNAADSVLLIHGTDDEVISLSHSLAAIVNSLQRPVEPLWAEGAEHNGIEYYEQYYERLKQFVSQELMNL
uniref:Uncharacterized protein n=1 Tax=Sphaerodactylus townsendi TaxID=933632 RepID=A0ACB8FZV9_9SAUR